MPFIRKIAMIFKLKIGIDVMAWAAIRLITIPMLPKTNNLSPRTYLRVILKVIEAAREAKLTKVTIKRHHRDISSGMKSCSGDISGVLIKNPFTYFMVILKAKTILAMSRGKVQKRTIAVRTKNTGDRLGRILRNSSISHHTN